MAFTDGFHDRTFGAMSATMQEKIQAGFSPLLPNFVASPFNDVVALEQILEKEKLARLFLKLFRVRVAFYQFLQILLKL